MDFFIEEFKLKHVEEVVTLHSEEFDGWGMKGLISELSNYTRKNYVAIKDDKIIAHASFSVFDGVQLNFICVKASLRQKGIGENFLKECLALLNARKVVLEVRSKNIAAIKLYEKVGFITLAKRKNLYSAPLDDGIVMEYRKKEI